MTVKGYISTLRIMLYTIFYAGIIWRIARTFHEGQMNEDYPTLPKVKRLLKAGVIGVCLNALIEIIAKYYE